MKMKTEHYQEIKTSLLSLPQETYTAIYNQAGNRTSKVRFAFDLLCWVRAQGHTGYEYVCKVLYPYLNDSHIETAMCRMIDEIAMIRSQSVKP